MKKYILLTLILVSINLRVKASNPQCSLTLGPIIADNRCSDGTGEVEFAYTVNLFSPNTTINLTTSSSLPQNIVTVSLSSYNYTSANNGNGQSFNGLITINVLIGSASLSTITYTIDGSISGASACSLSGTITPINFGLSCFPQTIEAILDPEICGCSGEDVTFYLVGSFAGADMGGTYLYDFGDNTQSSVGTHSYATAGFYTVTLTITSASCPTVVVTHQIEIGTCCPDCITSFHPASGEKYVISLWVKEDTPNQVSSYLNPAISLDFSNPNPGTILGPFTAKGKIIDGWQKIEEVITIPVNSWNVDISLINGGNNEVYFDDIRMHPFNSSMKSYVYDPVSLRLWAELDENNYATFYQYDEEGKLIRIKKETSRGIKTIQESREGSYKKEKVFDNRLNTNDTSN